MKEVPVIDGLPKLTPDVKMKWIEALRSGEYAQGKAALRKDDDRMCCLGVLCDLHHKATHQYDWQLGGDVYNYDGVTCYPPDDVLLWAGMQYENFRTDHIAQELLREHLGIPIDHTGMVGYVFAYMNDNLGYTFEDIANFVETNM